MGQLQAFLANPVAEPQPAQEHGEGKTEKRAQGQVQPGPRWLEPGTDQQDVGADQGRDRRDHLQYQHHQQGDAVGSSGVQGPGQQRNIDGRCLA
ncbi:hypothetical protein D3C72_2344310 [compost metagenome]